MDVTIGSILGAYRLDRLVGKGSMGVVYVAEDVHLRRNVALKVLNPELANDERFRLRFLQESQLAASLEHPHIVPIYAAGEEEGSLFLAMRWIEGSDLRGLLQSRHHLEPRRTIALLGQVASALDAAHAIGLVHRDVKPANVLVTPGPAEHTYLCDFGLAKHASSADSLTGERSFVGTISYIAPEQIEGGPVDARADQYALACVLYECLTGVKPYERDGELQTLFAHLREDAPRVTDVEPGLGVKIDAVLARALDKDPAARFTSCVELVAAAGEALGIDVARLAPAPQELTPRTFMIADIRGYTAFTSEHGDEAAGKMTAAFEQAMRETVGQHEGRVLEIRGDEALAVFPSARNALRAALAAQARFAEDPPARGVGIGIDTGEAAPTGEGYRGSALNTAARLCSLAGPGETFASDTTTRVAGAGEGFAYGKSRQERVKGIPEPVRFAPVHPPGPTPRPARRRLRVSRPRSGRVLVLGLALLVVLGGVGAGAWALRSSKPGLSSSPVNAFAIVDATSGAAKGSMNPGSSEVGGLVRDGRNFWAISGANGVFLQQIDTLRRTVTRQIPLAHPPYTLAPRTAFGALWFTWTVDDQPQLARFDTLYARVAATVDLPLPADAAAVQAEGVAVTTTAVWVAYGSPKRVARIDPRTNKVTTVVDLPEAELWGDTLLAAGDGQLWAIDRSGRRIVRLDPETGEAIARGRIREGFVEDAGVAAGSLWLPVENDGGVWQLDEHATVVGKVETGQVPWGLAVDGTDVYVSNQSSGTVTRIDATTGETRTYELGHRPLALGISGGNLWSFLAESVADVRLRITGSRVIEGAVPGDPYGTDPAQVARDTSAALQYAVGVRLMELETTPAGKPQLVPSGATAQPVITNGGRTYTFRVRSGLRFSPPSNAPVTARTWKLSLERALSPVFGDRQTSYCQYVLPDLVGHDAYLSGAARHISGIRAKGDTISLTLTKPSATLPARLASHCFTVVPPGTPAVEGGLVQPIASAGPYFIDAHIQSQVLVLRANPSYRGERPPKLDAIVLALGADPGTAVVQASDDEIDYTALVEVDPPASLTRVARELGAAAGERRRFFAPPGSGLISLRLNTTLGPLRDPDVRHAVSLALDRQAIAAATEGAPATRMIPPGVPGHAPDTSEAPTDALASARKLLRGRRVTLDLATVEGVGQQMVERSRLIRASLARVGIKVNVKVSSDPWAAARAPGSEIDILFDGWAPDFADPENILNELLDPERGGGGFYPRWFLDPIWIEKLRATSRITGPRRAAAYERLDRDLQDGPLPIIPVLFRSGTQQLFSSRVGCHSFLAQYSGVVDLSSLCLREQ